MEITEMEKALATWAMGKYIANVDMNNESARDLWRFFDTPVGEVVYDRNPIRESDKDEFCESISIYFNVPNARPTDAATLGTVELAPGMGENGHMVLDSVMVSYDAKAKNANKYLTDLTYALAPIQALDLESMPDNIESMNIVLGLVDKAIKYFKECVDARDKL